MATKNVDNAITKAVVTKGNSAAPAVEAPAMRRNAVLRIDIQNDVLTMQWVDGVSSTLDVSKLSDEVRRAALENGLRQKLADGAAMSRNPETGRSATVTEKRARVDAIAQNLRDGNWTAPARGGSSSGTSARELLIAALCRMNPTKTADVIRTAISAKTLAEVAAMAAVPRVASVISEIQAERIGSAVEQAESAIDELIGG